MNEVTVSAGDIIFVPAGTVHAIGEGVLLNELQEYSDITYRMYDYGRLTSAGVPRELHVERSLDVSYFGRSPRIKMHPLILLGGECFQDLCLVAFEYFVTRELVLMQVRDVVEYMNTDTA